MRFWKARVDCLCQFCSWYRYSSWYFTVDVSTVYAMFSVLLGFFNRREKVKFEHLQKTSRCSLFVEWFLTSWYWNDCAHALLLAHVLSFSLPPQFPPFLPPNQRLKNTGPVLNWRPKYRQEIKKVELGFGYIFAVPAAKSEFLFYFLLIPFKAKKVFSQSTGLYFFSFCPYILWH